MPEHYQGASPILLLEWWKPVAGRKGKYEVSCIGSVRRVGSSKALKPHLSAYGYPSVSMAGMGAKCVHIIVAEAFHGRRPLGKNIDHVNGKKRDFRASNLEYVTQAENIRRAGKLGLTARGEMLPQSKLTDDKVRRIKQLRGTMTPKQIAEEIECSVWIIYKVFSRTNWDHVK